MTYAEDINGYPLLLQAQFPSVGISLPYRIALVDRGAEPEAGQVELRYPDHDRYVVTEQVIGTAHWQGADYIDGLEEAERAYKQRIYSCVRDLFAEG